MKAALYTRVSTVGKTRTHAESATFIENPQVQEQPLRDLAAKHGWSVHRVYSDRASGAKQKRPGLNALMADARRGLFDAVFVWRFDRFARSVPQLVLAIEEFCVLGIHFISHQDAVDTSTPMGKAMFTVIAAMAEMQPNVIRERVLCGLELANKNGTRSGRPVGRPRVALDGERIRQLRDAAKLPWPEIARRVRSSNGSVRRAYKFSR